MGSGRVIVAMSGGVDSSVAALLLKERGYDVIGVTMRLWTVERDDVPRSSKRCCSVEDVGDARRVCDAIDIPHYVINVEREFRRHVVDYFCQEYERGRTPHPCLACNDKIKFDFLLRRARFLEADHLATGHYARIQPNGSRLRLLKGVDQAKDQSYALFSLTQDEMRDLLLPIGEYRKGRIREIAAEAGLPVAGKPDSQEICFIPDGDYRKFVADRTKPRPGQFVDSSGTVIGTHPGIQFFTVGQRRGLGLNGNNSAPKFVVRIDPETNQVVLGPKEELFRHDLWATRLSFTTGQAPTAPLEVTAKIRYGPREAPATLTMRGDRARVHFHQPQQAVTPGQAVVFYQGDELIGGGFIDQEPATNEGPVDAAGDSTGELHLTKAL